MAESKRVTNKRVSITWDKDAEEMLTKIKLYFLNNGKDINVSETIKETMKFFVEKKKL